MEKGAVSPPGNSSWSNAQPLSRPGRPHSSFTACFGTEGCCRDASVGSHLHKAWLCNPRGLRGVCSTPAPHAALVLWVTLSRRCQFLPTDLHGPSLKPTQREAGDADKGQCPGSFCCLLLSLSAVWMAAKSLCLWHLIKLLYSRSRNSMGRGRQALPTARGERC